MLINVQNGKITAIAENDNEANALLITAGLKVVMPMEMEIPETIVTSTADILDEALRPKRKYTLSSKPRKTRKDKKNKKAKVHCPECNAFVIKTIGLKTHMFLKHGLLSKNSPKLKEGMGAYDMDNLAKPLLTNPLDA